MFFIVSKILGAVFAPLNLIALLLIAGAILIWLKKKWARSFFVLAFLLTMIGGIIPLGPNLLVWLENRYERPQPLPERVAGILVLGGTFMTDISEARGVHALNESGERVLDALELSRQYPDAILVFSGGNGHLLGGARTEAQDTAAFLDSLSINTDNVIYEDESRTTYENIKLSKALVLPLPDETWLLVTSAYHMPRALAVARKQGWGSILPYPVDYRTTGHIHWLPKHFDLLGNMASFDIAIHEILGLAAYQASGKISLPLP